MKNHTAKALLASLLYFSNTVDANADSLAVENGETVTTDQTVSGTDVISVEEGGALSVDGEAIEWRDASPGVSIENRGLIESIAAGKRAFDSGGSTTAPRTISITNYASGIFRADSDAIRINDDITEGTVQVTNAGLIESTGDGQAVDFDGLESTVEGRVQITNLSGGEIRSADADAVRPGANGTVDNSGIIYAGGATNTSSDGVDFQAHSGTVVNQAGGLISGGRHGITTDEHVTVVNYGTIVGRNGSGVGSDGSATVINYGRITGDYDGAGNGDGDGVDIDAEGLIENFGVIEALGSGGVTSGGEPTGSDGATIGGEGIVVNHTGALIYSVGGAVPIRKGTVINDGTIIGGSVAVLWNEASTVINTGTIDGAIIGILGVDENDTVINSGTISSPGIALDLQGGDDRLTLMPGSDFIGSVDGGDGFDRITLAGDGAGSFAGAANFELLEVASGDWTLTGVSDFALGTNIAAPATLSGTAETLIGLIDDSGTLRVDQAEDGAFAARLSGGGHLIKAGEGTLSIGDQPFSGSTEIVAGRLHVEGSLQSSVTVGSGGSLGGPGSVASVVVERGGAIVSGTNGIGALHVNGDLLQKSGSLYVVQIRPDQSYAPLHVSGTAVLEDGAQIAPSSQDGSVNIGDIYPLLVAEGGINGSYVAAASPGGATEFRLMSSADQIDGMVVRSGASLTALGATPNQAAVSRPLAALGLESAPYLAITADPSDQSARDGLRQLAGTVHASLRSAMRYDVLAAQDSVVGRLALASHRGVWVQFLASEGHDRTAAVPVMLDRETVGGMGGAELPLAADVRMGIAGGYTRTNLSFDPAGSQGRVGTVQFLGYASAQYGALRLSGAAGYARHHLDTHRNLSFDGFQDQDNAHYSGSTLHGFVEVAYRVPLSAVAVEPFVRIAALRMHTDEFAETGGAAALSGGSQSDHSAFSDLGARLGADLGHSLHLSAGGSWHHSFDPEAEAELEFLSGGNGFTVAGPNMAGDAVSPSVDIAWQAASHLTLSAGFDGMYGSKNSQSAGRITLATTF